MVNWEFFEQKFWALYSEAGRPGPPIRLLVGLTYLQHAFDLSDEQVAAQWVENPYGQYFCGETFFQHELPIDPSSLPRWRKRKTCMYYCKRCVIPSTRPGIQFDDEGICSPCRVAEKHQKVDWDRRRVELEKVAQWGRDNSTGDYDCIIGISGGKDSLRQALIAKNELGLRTLLVCCSYPPEQQSEIGAANQANIISLGFDTIIVGPAPEKWKELMKRAFYKYGNWCKPTEMALYAIPPRVATSMGIPLIFLGENNALVSGDLGGSMTGDANLIKYNNTLSGGDPSEYVYGDITEKDVYWHRFPTDEEMRRANIRIVYLGFYIEDFNQFANYEIAMKNGLSIRDVPREDIGALHRFEDLDEDFVHVNQLLKYYKLGFARTTDDCSHMIRQGMLTREEAIELVQRYEGKCALRYIEAFCRYLDISEGEFWRVAESFRNKEIWEQDSSGAWRLKNPL